MMVLVDLLEILGMSVLLVAVAIVVASAALETPNGIVAAVALDIVFA